jgi:hypothetical protein
LLPLLVTRLHPLLVLGAAAALEALGIVRLSDVLIDLAGLHKDSHWVILTPRSRRVSVRKQTHHKDTKARSLNLRAFVSLW